MIVEEAAVDRPARKVRPLSARKRRQLAQTIVHLEYAASIYWREVDPDNKVRFLDAYRHRRPAMVPPATLMGER